MRALRERSLEGRLSMDTFARRVGRAYDARSREELGELVRDLPLRSGAMRLLTGTVAKVSAMLLQLEEAWRRPRIPRLAVPNDGRVRVTIGRSPTCDLVLSEATVSRHHAELRRHGDDWTLTDLGSRNGTRLNGLQLTESAIVRVGDQVVFGAVRFRITHR